MALDFGKLNFSVSFNPTSAFPIDSRCYFENYDDAVKAAETAAFAGSTDTKYYFGQNVVVVDEDAADFYIIQPDGTLGEVGGKTEVSENIFQYNTNNQLELLGFGEATSGAQLVKGADGKISWVVPDATTVEGLSTAVQTLRTDVDTLSANTYTKLEVDSLISGSDHLRRKIVNSLDDINLEDANSEKFIFMVGNGLTDYDNKYQEYMVIDGVLESVGSWGVDLEDYIKVSDFNTALANKVSTKEGFDLISTDNITKLEGIEEGAEKNFISSVDTVSFAVSNGYLTLNDIAVSKVTGLQGLLDEKVDAEEGKGLSSNDFTDEFKTKLENLNLNDISNLQTQVTSLEKTVFGYTITDDESGEETQVLGLDDYIVKLQTNVSTLQNNFNTLDNKVGDLINNLPNTYVSLADFTLVVGDIEQLKLKEHTIDERVASIESSLTWQEL